MWPEDQCFLVPGDFWNSDSTISYMHCARLVMGGYTNIPPPMNDAWRQFKLRQLEPYQTFGRDLKFLYKIVKIILLPK